MNPFKRLKLKSQLRNCDYVLAGTVIKQQYYDSTKSTVINGLIDEFMANPNFDNALKLIEYNEMLTFYFTESCAGGLYVRKSSQDAQDDGATGQPYQEAAADAADYGEQTGFDAGGRADAATDRWADSWIGTRRQSRDEREADAAPEETWQTRVEETEQAKHGDIHLREGDGEGNGDFAGDAPVSTDEDWKRKFRQEKQQQILRESEALMEQLLSLDMRRRKAAPQPAHQEESAPAGDEWPASGLAAEEDAGEADMATRTYRIGEPACEEAAPAAEFAAHHEDPEGMDTATYKDGFGIAEAGERFAAEPSPGTEPDSAGRSPFMEPDMAEEAPWQPEPQAMSGEPADDADVESGGTPHAEPAKAAPEPPAHRLPRRSYANVIATLKIDIHTMATQLEDYRRQLSYNPPNEQQLIVWINALEDAIEEFSQVVDHLEEQH